MKMHQKIFAWGLLIAGLGLPHQAFAISGCSTASLRGIFDAQVSNLGLQTFLQSLNTAATAGTPVAGLSANANSLIGSQTGLGRYHFDGTGNIVGVSGGSRPLSVAVGKYTVNSDCTAKVTMSSGATFDAVIVQGGKSILYVRTDAAGGGNMGSLVHSGSCGNLVPGASYGFSFSGANSPDGKSFSPYSAIGAITLLNGNGFNLTETVYTSAGVQRGTATGTYSAGVDCTLNLKFSPSTTAPVSVSGLMVDSTMGLFVLQPDKTTTLAGTLVAQ
jgi:hypothetical protein